MRPILTKLHGAKCGYVNAPRQVHLVDALHALVDKAAVEPVRKPDSLGSDNKWQPILDLSSLNKFIKINTLKMETPEATRTSLQQGDWVTLVDFRDAYFHLPVHPQSQKFLRCHLNGVTCQSVSLPFGLSTAPMEFTFIAKEVRIIAQSRCIRLHQYLDDWLIRAITYQYCLQQTNTLVGLSQELDWMVNNRFSIFGLPVRPIGRKSQTHSGKIEGLETQGSDPICRETQGCTLQENDSHCPRVAQHALVLGSGGDVHPDPPVPATDTRPVD